MDSKYLILFPVVQPYRQQLHLLMDMVAEYTQLPPPYEKLPPHVTFHRPIVNIEASTVRRLVKSMALQVPKTRITVSDLFAFGKHYIVLPVHATRGLAAFWVGLNDLLAALPEYEHGEFDYDNTLHITVAEKTSKIFSAVWPLIKQRVAIESMTIPVEMIELYRKPIGEGCWEQIDEFTLS